MSDSTNQLQAVEIVVDKTLLENILADCGNEHTVAPAKFDGALLYLRTLFSIFLFEKAVEPRGIRSKLAPKLSVLDRNMRVLETFVRSPDLAELRDLLDASALDFNLNRSTDETFIDANKLFDDLGFLLRDARKIVDRFHMRQKQYDRLSQAQRAALFLTADENGLDVKTDRTAIQSTRHSYQVLALRRLSGFIGSKSSVAPEVLFVRHAAELYEHIFERPFAVTSKDNDSGVRYAGPAIRFSYALVTQLQLSDHFGANERQVINTIGDTWTNDKRRRSAQ